MQVSRWSQGVKRPGRPRTRYVRGLSTYDANQPSAAIVDATPQDELHGLRRVRRGQLLQCSYDARTLRVAP